MFEHRQKVLAKFPQLCCYEKGTLCVHFLDVFQGENV